MKAAWEKFTLRDLCVAVEYGYTASASTNAIGPKFLRITDIVPERIDWSSVPYCSVEGKKLQKFLLHHNDIVIARTGATVGYAKRLKHPPPSVFASYLVRLRLDEDRIDPAFAGAMIESAEYKDYILRNAGGAAQPNANAQILTSFELRLPPLATQHRIASILSAYDDLIENNTRRIAILEEMARRIYEEWFVRFRFPGHEQVKMVESEVGLIPEGWAAVQLGEVSAYINRGISPKYDDEGASTVINQKCIRGQKLSLAPARRQSKTIPPEKRVQIGDVLINSTGVGTLGRVGQVLEVLPECTVDTHVTIVRPAPAVSPAFLGMALINLEPYFEQQGVGATGQTELARGRIAETRLIMPPRRIQGQFAGIVEPIKLLSVKLARKNANLSATRDLLLPKLISGEIEVSDMPEPGGLAA